MYGAGLPLVLFFILIVMGLRDGDVSWTESNATAVVVLSTFVAVLTFQCHIATYLVPTVAIDVWLLFRLGIADARVYR